MIQASEDLDDQLNSIIETSWVVEWTLDDTKELLEKLQGMSFTVQLDDQSIEEVVWLSFRAWMWALVIALAVLALFFGFGYFYAKSKFT